MKPMKELKLQMLDRLPELYLGQKLSGVEISRILNVADTNIYKWLGLLGIPRRSQSEAMKIIWAKQPHSFLGRHHSEKTKHKISLVKKGKCVEWSEQHRTRFIDAVSKPHSLEHRRKIGNANRRRKGKLSQETIMKIRIARLRQVFPSKTRIENIVEEELKKLSIAYEPQFNLGDKFLCDFAIPLKKILIECDGDYWHSREDVQARDRAKDAYARKCGWQVIRLKERDILSGAFRQNLAKNIACPYKEVAELLT